MRSCEIELNCRNHPRPIMACEQTFLKLKIKDTEATPMCMCTHPFE